MKKFISILMVIVIVFSFAACSKNSVKTSTEGDLKVWYFNDEDTDVNDVFGKPENSVSPEEIFSSLKITEDMLYGVYTVNNTEKDMKKLNKELSVKDVEFDNGTFSVSSVPIGIYFGTEYLPDNESTFKAVTDIPVAAVQFIADGQSGFSPFTYEVNGNKIKFTSLNDITENGDFAYEIDDSVVFEYEFSLCGPYLTLTDGKDTIKLMAFSFTENNKSTTWISGYSIENTPLIDSLDYFSSQQDSIINYAVARDGSYYKDIALKLSDDGKCTIYLNSKTADGNEKIFVKEFAYIAQCSGIPFLNSFDIILFDGEKAYYYTDSISDREARIMKSEGIDVDNVDEDKLKEIAEKKADLYDDLYNEFSANSISVQINRSTGEIAMDSTVLFGGDSADLTNDGKEFLNKFVKAYTSIIYNEKYDGFISKTMVEGHIAPVSGTTYEGGLPLSEKRAENVMNYCLSKDVGVDTTKLASTMETVGYSQSKPVYDDDGNVDFAASRRVSFRFVINLDE